MQRCYSIYQVKVSTFTKMGGYVIIASYFSVLYSVWKEICGWEEDLRKTARKLKVSLYESPKKTSESWNICVRGLNYQRLKSCWKGLKCTQIGLKVCLNSGKYGVLNVLQKIKNCEKWIIVRQKIGSIFRVENGQNDRV